MRAPCAWFSAGIAALVLLAGCGSQGPGNGGCTLHVVRSEIWSLDAQDVPSTKRAMFSNNGDGIAVDCAGNVYVDGKIFQPNGTQIGSWGAGTNLAFGGPDGKTVRELKMNLPGLP